MLKADTLFSVAGIAAPGLGLIARYGILGDGFTIYSSYSSRHVSYAFRLETPCYGIAALFCLFAFVYSVGYIPFSSTMAEWHTWLSIGGVVLVVAGFAAFDILARHSETWGPELGLPGWLIVSALLGGTAVFLIAQAWFAVGLTRSLLRMHLR